MRAWASIALIIASLTAAASASADTFQIGALDPDPQASLRNERGCGITGLWLPTDGETTLLEPPFPVEAWTVPPGGGLITAWSTSGQSAGARFRLAVTRFERPQKARVIAHSEVETMSRTGSVETFPTRIPVQGGEEIALVAIDPGYYRDCAYPSSNNEDMAYVVWDVDDGQETQVSGHPYEGVFVNVSAVLARGRGASACTAPQLVGRRFVRARRLLKRAGCTVARARRSRATRRIPRRRLVVIQQSPRAGVIARDGSVDVRLGRRRG
jgi:hypothetical protein